MVICDMMWAGITLLALYLGGNIYLFARLWQLVATQPLWLRVAMALLFIIAALSLFVSFALRNAEVNPTITQSLFRIGSAWLVFLLYTTILLIIADVTRLIFPSLQHGTLYALGATTLLLIYGYINYQNPHIEHIEVTTTKPMQAERYRIVMASDIHLGYGTTRNDLARYVELINKQKGDVLVIVGDLIDNSLKPVIEENMCEEFQHIEAPDGIFLAPGNHEYISNMSAVEEYLSKSNIRLLRDSVVSLANINIIGRDDRSNHHRAELENLLAKCDTSHPTILLDHQPYSIAESAQHGIDIHLSGHTHRGQIWPLSWLTDAIYEQSHGYRTWEECHTIVSSGLSLWGPPFRIGTQSELWVIDIKHAE